MQPNDTTPDTIPYGYCHCGCGKKTRIAPQTANDRGWIRGEPVRFVHGHNNFLPPIVYDPGDKKICKACKQNLPVSQFGNLKRSRDGLNAMCKQCNAAYYRDYYANHAEKHLERTNGWRKNNKDAARAIKRNRQARERNGVGRVTLAEWEEVLSRFDGKCAKCGSDRNIEMDHVIPLARGGTHAPDNIQPLCSLCNRRKSVKTEDYRGRFYSNIGLPFDEAAD